MLSFLKKTDSLESEEKRLESMGQEVGRLSAKEKDLCQAVDRIKGEVARAYEGVLLGDVSRKEYDGLVKNLEDFQRELSDSRALLSGLSRKQAELEQELSQRYLVELPKEIERREQDHIDSILKIQSEAIRRHKEMIEWAEGAREQIRSQGASLNGQIRKLWKAQESAGLQKSRFNRIRAGLELGQDTSLEEFLSSLRDKLRVS